MGETELLRDINKSIDDIIENIDSDFLTISHKADADGLASGTVMNCLVDILKDFYGGYGNNEIMRIMEFEEEGDDSLTTISSLCEKNTYYIISDLGSLNQNEMNSLNNKRIINNAIVMDHHSPLRLNKKIHNINPKNYGIKEELSASSIAGLYAIQILNRIKKEKNVDKKRIANIEEQIDKLLFISLGGDQADMQGNKGATKIIYDYLINKKRLQKINSPFYGYKTKSFGYVVAESEIPFNLKYRLATKKELERKLDQNLSEEKYENIKKIFVFNNSGKFGLNKQYIDQLKEKNEIIDEYINLPLLFEHFTDDIKSHDERVSNSNEFFSKQGIETKEVIADMKQREEKIKFIKQLYKENLEAFADPLKLNEFLKMIDEENYCGRGYDDVCIRSWSPSEQGNFMTALSKIGKGDLFIKGVKRELKIHQGDNKSDYKLFEEINRNYEKYKTTIKETMSEIEHLINQGKLKEIKEGVYYLNLDETSLSREDLAYTGNVGQITVSTRLLPGNYGILLTSLSIDQSRTKISARINPFPKQKVDFGNLFSGFKKEGICYSGGGHKEAASCKLYNKNIQSFFEYINQENFGR